MPPASDQPTAPLAAPIAAPPPVSLPVCANCGAGVRDRFCSACGQGVQGTDRVRDIVWEWARAVFGIEGVLWGTLGALIFNPGRLTRDWWEGRRTNRMSPVRVLLTVVVVSSAIAWIEHALVHRAEIDIALLLQVFTYQTTLVSMAVIPIVMPWLLSEAQRRSTYQHVTFAIYESAVLGLVTCLLMIVLVFGGFAPSWLQEISLVFAPMLIPCMVLGLIVHAVAHLRGAYGVSWIGALLRTGVLIVGILIASLIVTMVLTFTGVNRIWMPQGV